MRSLTLELIIAWSVGVVLMAALTQFVSFTIPYTLLGILVGWQAFEVYDHPAQATLFWASFLIGGWIGGFSL